MQHHICFAPTYQLIKSRWEIKKYIRIRVTNDPERIVSKSYEKENVGSATSFKENFEIYKLTVKPIKLDVE